MERLYCYVGETGQDTRDRFFVVAVLIVGRERDELEAFLASCERDTRKHERKWTGSKTTVRLAYAN